MKTAEDILCETDTAFVNDCRTLFEWEDVIKAMKLYANQKLDEAADILRPYSSDGSSIVIEQKDTI